MTHDCHNNITIIVSRGSEPRPPAPPGQGATPLLSAQQASASTQPEDQSLGKAVTHKGFHRVDDVLMGSPLLTRKD